MNITRTTRRNLSEFLKLACKLYSLYLRTKFKFFQKIHIAQPYTQNIAAKSAVIRDRLR